MLPNRKSVWDNKGGWAEWHCCRQRSDLRLAAVRVQLRRLLPRAFCVLLFKTSAHFEQKDTEETEQTVAWELEPIRMPRLERDAKEK